MYDQINKEIELLQQGILRYKKIESMLECLKEQLSGQEDREKQYKEELKKEQLDVTKLGEMNLTTIFYTILGSKEEQIERERQEALAVQLKYDDIKKQIEDTRDQIAKLSSEITQYEDYESKYETLFAEKYQMLKQQNNEKADKITKIEQDILCTKYNLKEIEEAISAGNNVIYKINSASESLDSAENWGVWDMWGGGGLLTDMMKHSHIDEARNTVSEVQSLLNQFQTELTDVKVTSQINIKIDGFEKFADFFFDGLIADWVVQSSIHDSQESVENVKNEVNNVLRNLQQMKDNDNAILTKLEEDLSNLVIEA